ATTEISGQLQLAARWRAEGFGFTVDSTSTKRVGFGHHTNQRNQALLRTCYESSGGGDQKLVTSFPTPFLEGIALGGRDESVRPRVNGCGPREGGIGCRPSITEIEPARSYRSILSRTGGRTRRRAPR